ncbi:MAG: hypothetical protein M3Y76_06095 [Chloroflexota bacterium]|nr:hypothetical protein [Chloroflexota bacterium]
MTNRSQWLNTARLRDKIAGNGHAMPICRGDLFNSSEVGYIVSCTFAFAQSRSVPICMGSPPTYLREDE